MKRFLSLTLCLAMVAASSMAFAATSGTGNGDTSEQLHIAVVDDPSVFITSSGSSLGLAARELAGPDTFILYGGPLAGDEGRFEVGGVPDWGDGSGVPSAFGPGAWTPSDLTDQPVFWHISQTHAANLDVGTVGNHAMWSGTEDGDPLSAGWVKPTGYGNGWNDGIMFTSGTVADNSVGQTVALDFVFNHDTEPGYDYFLVEYDSAGVWTEVFSIDSSGQGVQYSTVGADPIIFTGNDYGGVGGDQIRIRLKVQSDVLLSDEDGWWETAAGAAQVDLITLSSLDIPAASEGWEGSPPYLFLEDKAPFAGDFSEVWGRMSDIDPCLDNATPIMGFFDADQDARNGPLVTPAGSTYSTGGSFSPNAVYGVTGDWSVNWTGGLSFDEVALQNEVFSPDILWDLPGTDDDDVDIASAFLSFDVWAHLPLFNGMFFVWHVSSALPGEGYSEWKERDTVY